VRVNTSIQALVDLMDDPDELVSSHVEDQLLQKGTELIPTLEEMLENSLDDPQRSDKIQSLLSQLRFEKVYNDLKNWIDSEDKGLIEGLFIVTKYQFPELTKSEFTHQFVALKEAIWLEINAKQTSFELVKIMNKVFYDHFDFKKSASFPVSPFDVFVNTALEAREGTDITLGLIYSIVAQSLDIPIYGVTPQQGTGPFMLAYLDKHDMLSLLDWGIDNNGVLFYISVSNKGVIVEPKRLKEAYATKGMDHLKSCFEPSPNTLLIKKYLQEICKSCENNVQFRYKIDHLRSLIQLF
tara:strand:+ start:39120 stop:40007 length:888 start_codon:yes stop_codon:yes gene_type:complete